MKMSEPISLTHLNIQDKKVKSRSTNNLALVAAAAAATYTIALPSHNSSTSLITSNTTHKLKMLKQHNQELEQHLRQQQIKDHDQQDSFLKKFSYISKAKNLPKINKRSHFENNFRKEKHKHNQDGQSNHNFSSILEIDNSSLNKNANRLGIVSNTNSPIVSLKQNHLEKIKNENINNFQNETEKQDSNENNDFNLNSNENNQLNKEKIKKKKFIFSDLYKKSFNSIENKSVELTTFESNINKIENEIQNKKLDQKLSDTYSNSNLSSSSLQSRNFKSYINRFLVKFNYFVLSPDDNCVFIWLIILNICVLYNLWLIIARQSFEKLQYMFSSYWTLTDAISDLIYFLDVIVQFRTGYLEQGLLVYSSKKLAINYVKSKQFLFDIFSLAPFELIEYKLKYSMPILRFPRFFKLYRLVELYYIFESRTLYPNVWRVANLTHILFLLGHWFAGFYFLISKAEDFKGHWSYPEPKDEFALLPRMYLRCLYWSTLTLTTIGDLPPPETNWQWLKEMSNLRYLFSIAVHYLAVFVIALIVGQVGNVITNRNANRAEFERLLDGAKQYMRNHNIPTEMQRRVQRWYDYSWSRGRMNGAGDIHSIGLLPDKLKTELALHVNLETLKKVTIFHECQPEFLHDLVLKMRAYIFTPGDMICRKGEIAREMFIIADGVLEVIGENGNIITKMYSGDFFGEIGILNLEGASNRRTADVRSVGYAELFSLSKEDVLSAVKDYPEAEAILIEFGKRRLNKNVPKTSVSQTSSNNLKINNEQFLSNKLENKCDELKSSNQSEINRLIKDIDSDVELGISLIDKDNRGLTTDMLGIPKRHYSEKFLSTLNSVDLSKISQNDELCHLKPPKDIYNKPILDYLENIIDECKNNNINRIEKLAGEIREQILKNKSLKYEWLEEIIGQKDAKIKLLDSRIKILQKYVTQKSIDS